MDLGCRRRESEPEKDLPTPSHPKPLILRVKETDWAVVKGIDQERPHPSVSSMTRSRPQVGDTRFRSALRSQLRSFYVPKSHVKVVGKGKPCTAKNTFSFCTVVSVETRQMVYRIQ